MKLSPKPQTLYPIPMLLAVVFLLSCTSVDVPDFPAPGSLVSSSSSGDESQNWCVYSILQLCYPLTGSTCPSGGDLDSYCPYSSSSSDLSNTGGSSSSGNSDLQENDYCIFVENQSCLQGTDNNECLILGGKLSNSCPYGSSSSIGGVGSSSSNGGVVGGSSSSSHDNSDYYDGDKFIDQRDGKAYKYEVAPNGRVWMSENLNYSRGNTLGWCYGIGTTLGEAGADLSSCDGGYGRTYTYEIAIDENSPQGLCPNGWHIPSKDEWSEITISNMSNDFYTSIKAGNYDNTSGWKERGVNGFYWTSDLSSDFVVINSGIAQKTTTENYDYFSVRCTKELECGGTQFKPSTHFCLDNQVYSKCGTSTYDPVTQKCESNIVFTKCGSLYYNSLTEFCYEDNAVYDKCGTSTYNPTTQICENGIVLTEKCGDDYYNPATQVCEEGDEIKFICRVIKESETIRNITEGMCMSININCNSNNNLNFYNYDAGTGDYWSGTVYCTNGSSKKIVCDSRNCESSACATGAMNGAYIIIEEIIGTGGLLEASCYNYN